MKKIASLHLLLSAALLAFSCAAAPAQPRHRVRPVRPVAALASRPMAEVRVSSRSPREQRLSMALAWLAKHRALTVRQYARLTGLSRAEAAAELDAFTRVAGRPIALVVSGKKKQYVRR